MKGIKIIPSAMLFLKLIYSKTACKYKFFTTRLLWPADFQFQFMRSRSWLIVWIKKFYRIEFFNKVIYMQHSSHYGCFWYIALGGINELRVQWQFQSRISSSVSVATILGDMRVRDLSRWDQMIVGSNQIRNVLSFPSVMYFQYLKRLFEVLIDNLNFVNHKMFFSFSLRMIFYTYDCLSLICVHDTILHTQ